MSKGAEGQAPDIFVTLLSDGAERIRVAPIDASARKAGTPIL
jgi:hypothetical protein